MNTITIELCKEDRQRIDELIAFAGLLVGELKSRPAVEAPAETATATEQTATLVNSGRLAVVPTPVKTEHPVDAVSPHGEPEPVAEPETPAVTLDDIQALVLKLASPAGGKRDQVRAIVKEYAERVSLIKPEKFAEVMDKLTALDKEG